LTLVGFLRSVGRFTKLAAIFGYGAIELIAKRPATREDRAEWLHQFSGRAVRSMGIAVRVEGRFPERGAVISNHMGYLDIMTFAALHRVVFVSKSEMKQVPLLGWMTTMSGTVYVERGRGGSAMRARGDIQATAEASIPIVFFPEGTTTNGSTPLLKFHTGILAQVLDAGEPVTAAFVKYRFTEDNGPEVTLANIAYWDDTPLFKHIFQLLALRGIEVSVRIADEPISFSGDATHRKVAAEEARAAVMELGGVRDAVAAG
jgi:1-acyl-sn-glycerol-3-phosphate acyltransferase